MKNKKELTARGRIRKLNASKKEFVNAASYYEQTGNREKFEEAKKDIIEIEEKIKSIKEIENLKKKTNSNFFNGNSAIDGLLQIIEESIN